MLCEPGMNVTENNDYFPSIELFLLIGSDTSNYVVELQLYIHGVQQNKGLVYKVVPFVRSSIIATLVALK